MIVLVPEAEVPLDISGRPILGGIFAVAHKAESDNLINDRRAPNANEKHLRWASLPHGAQLCRLILKKGKVVRGSGDDLSNYFYLLQHCPDWVVRNAFGKLLKGED